MTRGRRSARTHRMTLPILLPAAHLLAPYLAAAGFISGTLGMQAILRSHQSSAGSHQSKSSVTSLSHQPQSSVGSPSHQPSVEDLDDLSAAGPVAGAHSHAARRPSKSTVSSPFARRYFDPAATLDLPRKPDDTNETAAVDESDEADD